MRVRRTIELRNLKPESFAHVSDHGANEIAKREGVIPYAYLDSQHYPTAWIGHLIELTRRSLTQADFQKWGSKKNPAPHDKIMKFFREVDLKPYELVVYKANQKRVANGHKPITQNQFDATVSLVFNIGTGGFQNSTVRRRIEAGASTHDVAEAFMMWDKPSEIVGRRKTERDQYAAG
jgi:GH24 family phage-related lysozyme (muramidase)